MRHPRSRKGTDIVTSKLTLPFTACWGDHVLEPGEYDLLFIRTQSAPVVVIQGMGVTAMVAASHVNACDSTRRNALFVSPSPELPQVQLLRLASTGVDLRFQESLSENIPPGVLALPLQTISQPGKSAPCS